jgi:hypothetical protein
MQPLPFWRLIVSTMLTLSGFLISQTASAGRCESILSDDSQHGHESFDVARLVRDLFREVPKQSKPLLSFLRRPDELAGAQFVEIDSALFRSVLENSKALDSIDGFLVSYLDSKLTRLNSTFVPSHWK